MSLRSLGSTAFLTFFSFSMCQFASAVQKEAPKCEAYLTGENAAKTPGPFYAELQSRINRYAELTVGIGWGEGSSLILTRVGAKQFEINRDTLPTFPELGERASQSFVIATNGRLKQALSSGWDRAWAGGVFKVYSVPRAGGGSAYELSTISMPVEADDDHLFVYLTALNAAPYVSAFELTLDFNKFFENSDMFEKTREALVSGDSHNRFGTLIAPPAILAMMKMPMFKSWEVDISAHKDTYIVRDPTKAEAFLVTYRFTLAERKPLH